MRLTQILLRKRKMNKKPESFVRSWQWNNAWYLAQERPIYPMGFKEAVLDRGLPLRQPEDVVSDIHEPRDFPSIDITETSIKEVEKDEFHPLYKATPAYTYGNRTWLPKINRLETACAITNSESLSQFQPKNFVKCDQKTNFKLIKRVENMLKDVYIGDAVQRKLPRNFAVPYIGWHPVESKMRPRNLYDHTQMSWGRSMPREFGVPNSRKLMNLCRGLFNESVKLLSDHQLCHSVDAEMHTQFIRRPDDKLVRFKLTIPMSVYGRAPLPPVEDQSGVAPVPDLTPLDPVATLHPTNIYHDISCHPVTSISHSRPFTHTVMQHSDNHIYPLWRQDAELARTLMTGFAVALGQARLRYGDDIRGTLPQPIRVNVINTDGQRYSIGCVQINSMDIGSKTRNLFCYHPETLELFEFCGHREGAVVIEGLNMKTYEILSSLITEGVSC